MHRRSAALRVPDSLGAFRKLERNYRMGSSNRIGHAGFPATFDADATALLEETPLSYVRGSSGTTFWRYEVAESTFFKEVPLNLDNGKREKA